jgi:ribulose bisphosphate carboxylase small subunit
MALIPTQLNFFEGSLPYKYIIDTSAILSQKPKEKHRRTRFKSLWGNIDKLIRKQVIVISSEIMEEVDDKDVQDSLKQQNCRVIGVDEEVQANVAKVVAVRPGLVDFKQNKSSGDAFLIATAMKYGLTVITEENPDKTFKIPKVCECLGIQCIDILGLCELEDWEF